MDVEKYEKEFKKQTGMDLYEASLKYGLSAGLSVNSGGEALQLYELLPEGFEEGFKQLIIVTLKEAKAETSSLTNAIEYSKNRSFYICREDKFTHISKHIFNEEELIQALLTAGTKAMNPVILMNSGEKVKEFRSVLRFTREFTNRNKYIKNVYAGKSYSVTHQTIDFDLLSKYTIIDIQRKDIIGVELKVFHPIVRGKILQLDFDSLVI